MSTTIDVTADSQSSYYPDDALNNPGETNSDWAGQFGGTENLIQYFSFLDVPASVTINSATVTLYVDESDGAFDTTDLQLVVSIFNASNQTFFPGTGNLSDPRLSSLTFFDGSEAEFSGGQTWYVVDISAAMQELVNLSGWADGHGFWLGIEDASRQSGTPSADDTDVFLELGQVEVVYTGGGPPASNISKVSGVSLASISKVSSVAAASILKIEGVTK